MYTFRRTIDLSDRLKLSFPCPRFGSVRLNTVAVYRNEGVPLSFSFRDIRLRWAEESLVAGCLDHEHCLTESLRLPWRFFRSEMGGELERVFYILVLWYRIGAYDGATNRDRLGELMRKHGEPGDDWWVEEDLFDGATAVPAYCVALVDALLATYQAQDDAVAAVKALYETPILTQPPAPPSPAKRPPAMRPRPKKGGSLGGVD